jgi:hypothetical protein
MTRIGCTPERKRPAAIAAMTACTHRFSDARAKVTAAVAMMATMMTESPRNTETTGGREDV